METGCVLCEVRTRPTKQLMIHTSRHLRDRHRKWNISPFAR